MHRVVTGPGLWGIGSMQGGERLLAWDGDPRAFPAEAARVIAGDLAATHPDPSAGPTLLASGLAYRVERGLKRSPVYRLQWLEGQRAHEQHLPPGTSVVGLYSEVRRYERLLRRSGSSELDVPDPTVHWDISALLDNALAHSSYPKRRAINLARYAMDLKFKACCIFTVDIPVYRAALQNGQAPSPRASLIGLSYDASLAFKCRALWETVMNLTYDLEEGRDAEAFGRNKSERWWRWVRANPRWRGLYRHRRVLERFDSLLRTPEAHKHSRLRSVFTTRRSPAVHRALAQELADATVAVWDQLVIVVGFDGASSYARGGMRIGPSRSAKSRVRIGGATKVHAAPRTRDFDRKQRSD